MDLILLKDRMEELGVDNPHIASGEIRAACPFHGGGNPTSFAVNLEKGAHCFSCRTKFHTVDDLIKALSERAGVGYVPISKDLDFVFDFLEMPREIKPAPVDPGIIQYYEEDFDHFYQEWGVSREVHDRHQLKIDPFTGAECFPIFDRHQNFWGFVERSKGPKRSIYRYPKGLDKKTMLIGEGSLPKHLDEIWVVEGVRDLCAVETKLGVRAVALGGASLAPEQAKILSRVADKVVCATDNDEAGQGAWEQFEEKIPLSKLYTASFDGKDPMDATGFEVFHAIF